MIKKILLYPIGGHFAFIWLIILSAMEITFQSYLKYPCMVCSYGDDPIMVRAFFFVVFYLTTNLGQYSAKKQEIN
jgi:hypothetical protein